MSIYGSSLVGAGGIGSLSTQTANSISNPSFNSVSSSGDISTAGNVYCAKAFSTGLSELSRVKTNEVKLVPVTFSGSYDDTYLVDVGDMMFDSSAKRIKYIHTAAVDDPPADKIVKSILIQNDDSCGTLTGTSWTGNVVVGSTQNITGSGGLTLSGDLRGTNVIADGGTFQGNLSGSVSLGSGSNSVSGTGSTSISVPTVNATTKVHIDTGGTGSSSGDITNQSNIPYFHNGTSDKQIILDGATSANITTLATNVTTATNTMTAGGRITSNVSNDLALFTEDGYAACKAIRLKNAGSDPGSTYLSNNGGVLKFHDGTAIRTFLHDGTANITVSGALTSNASNAVGISCASGYGDFKAVKMENAASDPGSGYLQSNAGTLKWHDGTAVRTLLHDGSAISSSTLTATISNDIGVSCANGYGDFKSVKMEDAASDPVSGYISNNGSVLKWGNSMQLGTMASSSSSALLELNSTTKGLRIPVMTASQCSSISSPVSGLIVYDSTYGRIRMYNGSTWESINMSYYETSYFIPRVLNGLGTFYTYGGITHNDCIILNGHFQKYIAFKNGTVETSADTGNTYIEGNTTLGSVLRIWSNNSAVNCGISLVCRDMKAATYKLLVQHYAATGYPVLKFAVTNDDFHTGANGTTLGDITTATLIQSIASFQDLNQTTGTAVSLLQFTLSNFMSTCCLNVYATSTVTSNYGQLLGYAELVLAD